MHVVEDISDISASKCQWCYYLPQTIGNGHVEDLSTQTQTEVECTLLGNLGWTMQWGIFSALEINVGEQVVGAKGLELFPRVLAVVDAVRIVCGCQ